MRKETRSRKFRWTGLGMPMTMLLASSMVFLAACGNDDTNPTSGSTISSSKVAHNIPNQSPTLDLQVQAAYNTTDGVFFWKLSWAGNEGKWHDYWRYDAATNTWEERGGDFREVIPGDGNTPVYESRATIMVNDPYEATTGSVPNFSKYGCFLTCHDDRRNMPGWTALGRSDEPTKGLPTTGYSGKRLDLWHWRAHRSNPIGYSDDQYVDTTAAATPGSGGGGRKSDTGTAPFATNSLVGTGPGNNPTYVFDPATTTGSVYAFKWSDLFTTPNFFFTNNVINPKSLAWPGLGAYAPSDGDTVPKRRLSTPTLSRGNITSTVGSQTSAYNATMGRWNVYLKRLMDTTYGFEDTTKEDVTLVAGNTYDVAFGIHQNNAGNRDHYVSLPLTLGLGTGVWSSAIVALALAGTGAPPDFSDTVTYPIKVVEMFLPGIASWEFLTATQSGEIVTGKVHGGYEEVAKGISGTATVSCAACHVVKASDPNAASALGGALETKVARRGGVVDPTPISLRNTVVDVLQSRCLPCHSSTGTASKYSFGAFAVDATTVYNLVRGTSSNFLNYSAPDSSRMVVYPAKNTDGNHPATGVLTGFDGSADQNVIKYWIRHNAQDN